MANDTPKVLKQFWKNSVFDQIQKKGFDNKQFFLTLSPVWSPNRTLISLLKGSLQLQLLERLVHTKHQVGHSRSLQCHFSAHTISKQNFYTFARRFPAIASIKEIGPYKTSSRPLAQPPVLILSASRSFTPLLGGSPQLPLFKRLVHTRHQVGR